MHKVTCYMSVLGQGIFSDFSSLCFLPFIPNCWLAAGSWADADLGGAKGGPSDGCNWLAQDWLLSGLLGTCT